jgi:hypothetical protein
MAAEPALRVGDSARYRRHRHFEPPGDFGVAPLQPRREHQDQPIGWSQLGQRHPDQGAGVQGVRIRFRRCRRGHLPPFGLVGQRQARAAQPPVTLGVHEPANPSGKRIRVAQLAEPMPRDEKRILRGVFGE